MRNKLPKNPLLIECGIINLDFSENPGTHWVAYTKIKNHVEYFDSYGNLRPPKEFIKYMQNSKILYNYDNIQKKCSYNCGHLCLAYLKTFWSNAALNK